VIGVGSLILTAYLASGVAVPTVASVAPALGDTLGGELLTVIGTNFTGATAVTIGGTAAVGFSVISSTEIIAIAPAHAAATGQSILVTAPGGTNGANTLYEFWSPAVLALTGFWERGDYDAQTATWTARASAGASGGRNLTQATAANVPTETNLEPVFNGVSGYLDSNIVWSTYVTASAGTLVCVFLSNADGAPAVQSYDDPTLIANVGNNSFLSVNGTNVRAALFDAAYQEVNIPVVPGGVHIATLTWNGTIMSLSIDGGAPVTHACGPVTGALTGVLRVGSGWNASAFQCLPGIVRSVAVVASVVSGPDLTKIVKWAQARHGVSV
jgi:hypothetical protein